MARTRDLEPPKRRRNGNARRRTAREVRSADGALFLLIFFLGITALLRMAGESAARSFFNVYLELDLGASTLRIGLLLAFGQLVAGPAALCAPALANRAGKVPVIVVTTAITAASLVIMALVPHWAAAGIGFTLVVGMRSVTQSVTSVVHMEIVPANRRGVTSGVTSMSMGLGFSSMALGGGYLIPALGFPRPLPGGRSVDRGKRTDLLAVLPRAAGRVPAVRHRTAGCRGVHAAVMSLYGHSVTGKTMKAAAQASPAGRLFRASA